MESFEQDKSQTLFPLNNNKKKSKQSEPAFQVNEPTPNFVPKLDELIPNAEVLIRGKEYDLAKNLIGRSLQFYPKNLDLLNLLAEVSVILEDWDMVEKSYLAIVKIDSSEENVIKLCETLQRQKKYEDAKKHYLDLLARKSVNEEFLFQIYKDLGNLSIRDGDLDSAEEFYNKAFSFDHYSDALLVNYGTLELKKDNMDMALVRFREALQINPANSHAWVGLALIHRQYGDIELSYANINSALDHDPYNRSALKLFSDWSAAQGKSGLAIVRLTHFLERYDQDDEILLVYAKLLFVMGRYQLALLEAEKAFSLNPDNHDTFDFINVIRPYAEERQES